MAESFSEVREQSIATTRHLVDTCKETMTLLDAKGIGAALGLNDLSLVDMLDTDLASFCAYLSAADGHVDSAEADFMNRILDKNLTAAGWTTFIKNCHVYSVEFEQTVPLTAKIASIVERTLGIDGYGKQMYTVYEGIGNLLIMTDGDVDPQEKADLETYLSTLRRVL